MTDELDCRLFVAGAGDRDALTARLRDLLGLAADGRWLTRADLTVLVDKNPYSGEFAPYPLSVEWYFEPDVTRELRIEQVGSAMLAVRAAGGRVLAACDYEDELP
ncbi:hypothetical protein OJ997_27105 [Solirubrobacter phytolaccae]|uniref:Uncharacterized protein n=1 Tax=Solirubrobacter phytolaccae TaxID=1404360 RepID=A0A9X3NDA9_9ACTN|nr:hypothetical protein [Solirubrobacter phytolaccae]MDA0184006.1 hypothetical protein [Solirubrobacter phytolaccae]